MDSNHLTTRTYTTPTCNLIVTDRPPVNFTLDLDDPDREELAGVTLKGDRQQLDRLQAVVSKHIAELVATFPLPSTTADSGSVPAAPPQVDPTPPIDTQLPLEQQIDSQRSGIIKNLPGLRSTLSQSPSATTPDPQPQPPKKSGVFNLFDRSNQPRPEDRAAELLADRVQPPKAVSEPQTPYLSGVDDHSLDRQLHLGNLATPTSGAVITLSAIQLFDLATVLDEYANERIDRHQQSQPAKRNLASIPGHGVAAPSAGMPDTSPRLPNSPKTSASTAPSQVYYQTRRSRSWLSGIPWAIAAALGLGVPLLLLDPNPNPLKEAVSKIKMPDLTGEKKSDTTTLPAGQQPQPTSSSTPAATTNPSSPQPWQTQPVEPPKVSNKPLDSSVQTNQDPTKIGIAPLPNAIVTTPGETVPTTVGSVNPSSTVAPNPLNTKLPSDLNKVDNSTGSSTTNPAPKTGTKPTPVASTPTKKNTTTKIGQLPLNDPSQTGKVSISKQPALTPPANLPPLVNNPSQSVPPIEKIDPATRSKTPSTPVKPTTVVSKTKPKPTKSTPTVASPTAFEPFTPIPKNPNLINPEPTTSTEPTEPQTPAIVPNQPLQSNGGIEDLPSLQETRRYFQSKWKANANQSNALQYVLQVSGKSGIVRSVSPQGEAATTYLQQTKFIKTGQKLISPAAAGTSDQRIRVLLQPDGNVDTFIEP
jgi:Domain of unknown function (DUF4335)